MDMDLCSAYLKGHLNGLVYVDAFAQLNAVRLNRKMGKGGISEGGHIQNCLGYVRLDYVRLGYSPTEVGFE